MKKYIKQIAILTIIAAFVSCSSDEELDLDLASVGGNVVPATTSISRLDNNYDIPLDIITKSGVTVTKIEIFNDGDKISDATIQGETAKFSTSALGSFDEFEDSADGKTGTFSLSIVSTYSDGSTTVAPYYLSVGKGIVWKTVNSAGSPTTTSATSGKSTIKFNDPTPVKISYATVKKGSTVIDNVTGEWSKNEGAFSSLPGDFSTSTQVIDIANIPYSTYGGISVGDKITYRFTVTAGTQTDVISTTITFVNQVFGSEKSGNISNLEETNKFSFSTGQNYDKLNTEDAEIVFVSGFGIKAEAGLDIQFVKSTLDYSAADLFLADEAYNAGTPTSSLTGLNTGDVVIYKITRDDVEYYGILKVSDRIQGTTSETLKFSYKEGILSI
jgi:hypothetical protein